MISDNSCYSKSYILERIEILGKMALKKADYQSKPVQQVINELLEADHYCGDARIMGSLNFLYEKDIKSFYENILENEEAKNVIKEIYNDEGQLNYYSLTKEEYKKNINSLFCYSFKKYFEYCVENFLNIGKNSMIFAGLKKKRCHENPSKVCFYYTDILFSELEESFFKIEKELPMIDFKESVIDAFIEIINNKEFGYKKWEDETWYKEDQEEYEQAFSNRFICFAKKVGYTKDVNINLNFFHSSKAPNVESSFIVKCISFLFITPLVIFFSPILLCATYDVIIPYFSGRNKMKKYLSNNIKYLTSTKKDLSIKNIVIMTEINPILLNDLRNIESTKKTLASYFTDQESFDFFLKANCEQYINPYLLRLKDDTALTKDEIEEFHALFSNVKQILDLKIQEFETHKKIMREIELKTIKKAVEEKLNAEKEFLKIG